MWYFYTVIGTGFQREKRNTTDGQAVWLESFGAISGLRVPALVEFLPGSTDTPAKPSWLSNHALVDALGFDGW